MYLYKMTESECKCNDDPEDCVECEDEDPHEEPDRPPDEEMPPAEDPDEPYEPETRELNQKTYDTDDIPYDGQYSLDVRLDCEIYEQNLPVMVTTKSGNTKFTEYNIPQRWKLPVFADPSGQGTKETVKLVLKSNDGETYDMRMSINGELIPGESITVYPEEEEFTFEVDTPAEGMEYFEIAWKPVPATDADIKLVSYTHYKPSYLEYYKAVGLTQMAELFGFDPKSEYIQKDFKDPRAFILRRPIIELSNQTRRHLIYENRVTWEFRGTFYYYKLGNKGIKWTNWFHTPTKITSMYGLRVNGERDNPQRYGGPITTPVPVYNERLTRLYSAAVWKYVEEPPTPVP